jgi:hypothetical protein
MLAENQAHRLTHNPNDVPVPIVTLSRWTYVLVLLAGLLLSFGAAIGESQWLMQERV